MANGKQSKDPTGTTQGKSKIPFKTAFRNARNAGKKTFTWNGKSYHTKTKSEVTKAKNEKTFKEHLRHVEKTKEYGKKSKAAYEKLESYKGGGKLKSRRHQHN